MTVLKEEECSQARRKHITKYTLRTSKINGTLKYNAICLAICIYLRKSEISDILNVTPLLMLSRFACYDEAHSGDISRLGGF